ncbi:MAG: hypothetical protein JNK50_15080 [Bacteroidia bacterium]|nr:hypothetical protein [Bacteroidia bacterium]
MNKIVKKFIKQVEKELTTEAEKQKSKISKSKIKFKKDAFPNKTDFAKK